MPGDAAAVTAGTDTGEGRGGPSRDMLSIVATSRNDDHGGNLLGRMQTFVDGFAEQCRRLDLAAELILVDWNPPPDRPPLAEALRWPRGGGPFSIRIIQVPPELHARLANADRLPLFQMVAKNVGIRRARGDFVLATNIDILFSDALVRFMRDRLRSGNLYRVDRYDVPADIPAAAPFAEVLGFCERAAFRINRRDGVYMVKERKLYSIHQSPAGFIRAWAEAALRAFLGRCLEAVKCGLALVKRDLTAVKRGLRTGAWRTPRRRRTARHGPRRFIATFIAAARRTLRNRVESFVAFAAALRRLLEIPRLHTNACGDFTLMARDHWAELRGYPEWQIFSWHLDSVLVHQAYGNGLRIVELGDPMRAYHIEHGVGSGWTMEGEETLFARCERAGIPYLKHDDFTRIAKEIRVNAKAKRPTTFNGADWGFADEDLLEVVVCASTASPPRAAHPSSLAGGA